MRPRQVFLEAAVFRFSRSVPLGECGGWGEEGGRTQARAAYDKIVNLGHLVRPLPSTPTALAYFFPPFRMTILPPMEKLRPLLEKLSQFHAKFTHEYS